MTSLSRQILVSSLIAPGDAGVVVQPLEMHQGHDPIVSRIDTIHGQDLDPVAQLGSHGAGKIE